MAWFSLAKIALQAGSKIYANRQKTKMAMSDAQLMHAEKMARGEEAYQGKFLKQDNRTGKTNLSYYFVGSDSCACLGSCK